MTSSSNILTLDKILEINLEKIVTKLETMENVYSATNPKSIDHVDIQRLTEGYLKLFNKKELIYLLLGTMLVKNNPKILNAGDETCEEI